MDDTASCVDIGKGQCFVDFTLDRASTVVDDGAMGIASAVDLTSVDPFPIRIPSRLTLFDPESYEDDHAFSSLSDRAICDVTGFTGAEKKMLWASWKEMTSGLENRMIFIRRLIFWMYECVPNINKVFSDKGAFLKHTYALIRELHAMVALLPAPVEMMTKIRAMTELHVNLSPSMGIKYFKPFHENFGTFVSGHLAQPPHSHVVRLWVSLIGIFYRVMADKVGEVDGGDMLSRWRVDLEANKVVAAETETKEKTINKKDNSGKQFKKQSRSSCCRLM